MLSINKKKVRGVAILTVMISLALMIAVITDLSSKEMIKYKLAINERDALQAESLAQSGINFAQLLLMVQEPVQSYFKSFAKMGVELPSYTVWELMPIDSQLLKGVVDGSFMPTFGLTGEDKATQEKPEESKNNISEEEEKVSLFGPYIAPDGGYGAFKGHFSTVIKDEESKLSIKKWPQLKFPERKRIADQIIRMLSKEKNSYLFDGSTGDSRGITPAQLVGNIYDYISEDGAAVDVTAPSESWGRNTAGDKRSAYMDTPNISPKMAQMDSIAELRLIPGMTDAIYHLLAKNISIYSESDGINILSASDEMFSMLFFSCTSNPQISKIADSSFSNELIEQWKRKKSEGEIQLSREGIIKFLQDNELEVDKETCSKLITTESKIFSVESTATVGTVIKTIKAIFRSAGGIITLYKFQVS